MFLVIVEQVDETQYLDAKHHRQSESGHGLEHDNACHEQNNFKLENDVNEIQ